MREWRCELEDLVARARAAAGDDEVREALADLVERLSTSPVRALAPSVAVLGVAACDAGRVGVLIRPSGQTTLHVGSSLSGLVEQVREQEALGVVGLTDAAQPDAVAWLASRPTVEVIEVPPSDDSSAMRRERLAAAGASIPAMYGGMGFGEGELLSACEAAVEAARLWS